MSQARAHVDTICVGRTHGVHAEPTTFGIKLAGFATEAARNRDRLRRAFDEVAFGAISGAAQGTYQGRTAAGPVGGLVGGALGAGVGAVAGTLNVVGNGVSNAVQPVQVPPPPGSGATGYYDSNGNWRPN